MTGNVVHAFLQTRRGFSASPKYQYDYGQRLILNHCSLPATYEVHFSNTENGTSTTSIGDSNGVEIPDQYFLSGQNIYFWLFLHVGDTDGETRFTGVIPIIRRARPTDIEPTPVQQNVITQAIALLNTAVERTSADVGVTSENARQAVSSAQSAAQSETNALSYAERAETARDTAVAATDRAETAATNARASEANAKESEVNAINAADRAEQAAAEAGYMFFYIDVDGHLRYQRTSNVVDVDFYLDDGHLYVKGVS